MNNILLHKLAQHWCVVQQELIPQLTTDLGPLSGPLLTVVRILEWARIEDFVERRGCGIGRPLKDRASLARAFVAKAVLRLTTTEDLRERLQMDRALQRICGFDSRKPVPDAATFSRAFAEMAAGRVGERCHQALIDAQLGDQLIGHITRDGTAIEAREKPAPAKKAAAEKTVVTPKHSRGRPKKGESRPAPEPTRLQRQLSQTLEEMVRDLPRQCDRGCKSNAQGYSNAWNGYKLHFDVADGGIPISVVLTSASVHDSQVAIPLAVMTAARVTSLYDVMDAAYCSAEIRKHSRSLGHVPLIDHNPRRGEKLEFAPHEAQRYKIRTQSERANARLKDEFGADKIYVRGGAKVMAHLMFGVLALSVDQLLRLLT